MEHYFSKGILPAVTVTSAEDALAVARIFLECGLDVLEIPFRTAVAREAVRIIRTELPAMYVGAGTVLTVQQVEEAKEAGAEFALAPGCNPEVVKKAAQVGLPFIPGVMTPSEVEQALALGCRILKLFPVQEIGGPSMLKALLGPYGHTGVQFIPMGGVGPDNMSTYLSLPNVIAVGGSWLAPPGLIALKDWEGIRERVRAAIG